MITVEQMNEIMEERFPDTETVDYYGNELIIRHTIPLATFCEIAKQVADTCFHPETGEYRPEYEDFALRLCIVGAYTNVELPDDVPQQYQILYRTDLITTVMRYISMDQFSRLQNAIDDRIIARNDANKVAFDNAVAEITAQINQIGEGMTELFSGVDKEDVQKLIAAIGENGVDEEKLVQAVVAEQNKQRGATEVIPFPAAETVEEPDGE